MRVLCLISIPIPIHGVGLPTPCLTVNKHSGMEARQHLLNHIVNLRLMVDGLLVCAIIEDLVETVVLCVVVAIVHDPTSYVEGVAALT